MGRGYNVKNGCVYRALERDLRITHRNEEMLFGTHINGKTVT